MHGIKQILREGGPDIQIWIPLTIMLLEISEAADVGASKINGELLTLIGALPHSALVGVRSLKTYASQRRIIYINYIVFFLIILLLLLYLLLIISLRTI